MKPLVLTTKQWSTVKQEIDKHHPRSVTMIRRRMREVLGFTPREHEVYLGNYDDVSMEDKFKGRYGYLKSIHLDFYDEAKRTMFLLKYGDFMQDKK